MLFLFVSAKISLLDKSLSGLEMYKLTFLGTYKNNLALLNEQRNKEEEILISSLFAELSELNKLLHREFHEKLKKSSSDKFEWLFPEGTDYFAIFNTSASQLGKIKSTQLRSLFISIYIELKYFYDALKTNTKILTKYDELKTELIKASNTSSANQEIAILLKSIESSLVSSKNDNLSPSYNRFIELFGEINNALLKR
jgi:hypothetical protein